MERKSHRTHSPLSVQSRVSAASGCCSVFPSEREKCLDSVITAARVGQGFGLVVWVARTRAKFRLVSRKQASLDIFCVQPEAWKNRYCFVFLSSRASCATKAENEESRGGYVQHFWRKPGRRVFSVGPWTIAGESS